jgi:hypothetical protein
MTNLERLPHVEAELNYLVPMAERPRYYAYEPAPGEPRANMMHEAHTVPIHDMRPIQSEIGLDSVGFALVEQRSGVRDFWDDDEVRRVYYPEAEPLSPRRPAPAGCSFSPAPSLTIHGDGDPVQLEILDGG